MVVETGGGDRGTRTPNLGIANAALSQLSYIPTWVREQNYSTVADRGGQAPGGPSSESPWLPAGSLASLRLPVMCLPASVPYVILRRAYEAAYALMICVRNRPN